MTDAKYNKIWIQTAFINKKDGLTQVLHDEISSLSLTSETVAASHPSIDSIHENSEKINTFIEQKKRGNIASNNWIVNSHLKKESEQSFKTSLAKKILSTGDCSPSNNIIAILIKNVNLKTRTLKDLQHNQI